MSTAATLYALLLQLEQPALVLSSVLLFAVLTVVMVAMLEGWKGQDA